MFEENNRNEIDGKLARCRRLIVEQCLKSGILDGPHCAQLNTNDGFANISIVIEQCGTRKISITSEKQLKPENLISIFQTIESLFMIFEGRFVPISCVSFLDSDSFEDEKLSILSDRFVRDRLSCYDSAGFLQYYDSKFIDFYDVISDDLYEKWDKLLLELDIAHMIAMYSVSDNGLPVDIRCAFLIELAEPLVELVSTHKKYFSSLLPGEKGTTLMMCIDAIISKYGEDIFDAELNNNYDKILKILVKSRVRIMHIIRAQEGPYFSGEESLLYIIKLLCLYRKILLEMLDIDYSVYQTRLKSYMYRWNKWENVLDNLIFKVGKKT